MLGTKSIIKTLADVTGDGSAHQLTASSIKCRWAIISAASGNGSDMRIGDVSTSNTQGATIPKGGAFILRPLPEMPVAYDLSDVYYFLANTDKLSVTYGE